MDKNNQPEINPEKTEEIKASEEKEDTVSVKTISTETTASENEAPVDNEALPEYSDENSTIFCKSNVADDKNGNQSRKKGNKKMLAILIAAVVLLAAGGFAIFKFLPNINEENNKTDFVSITVKKVSTENISRIDINNTHGHLVFTSTVNKSTSSAEDGSVTSAVKWALEGYDASLMADSLINSAADNIATISATRKMTDETLDYGLDNPKITAKVIMRDGSEGYTVSVGNTAPDSSGSYVKVSGVDGIYLVPESTISNIDTTPEKLVNSVIINAPSLDENTPSDEKKYFDADENNLTSFDTITMSGSFYGKTITLTRIDNEIASYMIKTDTVNRYADSEATEAMLGIMSNGIVAIDTYKIFPSKEDIKKYGLDNPDAVVTIKYGSKTVTLRAKMYDTAQNYYAVMIDGKNAVYAVTADALSMLEKRENDFYNQLVFLEYLKDFSNMKVVFGDKTYSYDISYNSTTEEMTVTSGGKKLDDSLLSSYYQYFTSLSPEQQSNYINAPVSLTATFTYSASAKGKKVVSFTKQSDRRYILTVDGQKLGTVTSEIYDKITTYAQYVIDGKGIPDA